MGNSLFCLHFSAVCVALTVVLPVTVGGLPLFRGQLLPLIERKGVLLMVTYSDLIQIGILIVGIIGIFMMYKNQKWPPLPPKSAVTTD